MYNIERKKIENKFNQSNLSKFIFGLKKSNFNSPKKLIINEYITITNKV